MKARFVAGLAFVTSLVATRAYAQQGPIMVTPGGGYPDVSESEQGETGPKTSSRSFKLFDSRNTVRSYSLDIGPIVSRQVQDETPQQRLANFHKGAPLAGEIAFGMVFKTPYKPFFLFGAQKTLFRVIDDKSFSWSIFHQELGGGLMLGPLEPKVYIGVAMLTADIFHAEPSIQILTPRVGAGVGLHLGSLTVDVRIHSEYLWRWFGPDYMIHGVSLGLAFDVPRPKPPLPEPQN